MTKCPCCGGSIDVPPLHDLLGGLGHFEAAVLEALWSGRGMLVKTSTLFDAMYADDPDGGPPPKRMYDDLRCAVSSLRSSLSGVGLEVKFNGRSKGWSIGLCRA